MADGAEYSGKTVEDAIAEAESQLGTGRDNLDIEIVSQGSRGVFGIRAESARIRASRRGQAAVATQTEPPATREPEAASAPISGTAVSEAPKPDGAQPSDLPEEGASVLRELLHSMGFDADVTVRSTQNPIMLGISGNNLGVLIGRRGDNLSALQFMVNLILSKNRRQWPRIVIDVENYRARREESLRTLADRIAYRVKRNQRPFTLEAMAAGDRRVIHLALRDRPDIETYSIGEGPSRRVVVAPRRAPGGTQEHYS